MLGGAYLCYEGAEKVLEVFRGPHGGDAAAARAPPLPLASLADPAEEERRVRGAIRTDLILSAEIMAITLASVADSPFWTRVFVLAVVGVGITALVYGVVAVIVKADDVGVALAGREQPLLRAARPRHRAGDAALPQGPEPARHRRHALGRRRDRAARAGGVRPGRPRPRDPRLRGEAVGHALGALGPAAAWLVAAAASGVFGAALGGADRAGGGAGGAAGAH